jgi:glucokinase
MDTRAGIIRWSPNFGETIDNTFHMFLDVPFTGPVSEALGLATYAGNDANIAALGEFRYGAGREVNDIVMFTLGTGIGSGVISEGRLVIGASGGASELGHHVIVAGGQMCACGHFGHMEAYCGTAPIIERALRMLENARESRLAELVGEDRATLTPKQIDDAAREGDPVALAVFEETGYYLGLGIANVIHIFNPARVVIGGGIRKATGLLDAARRSAQRNAVASLARDCQIVEAALGEDAGVMGAAELAWREVGAV